MACRSGKGGECRESETSVMCKDLLRMGYSNFIVDPGVRLAYTPDEARHVYSSKVRQQHGWLHHNLDR